MADGTTTRRYTCFSGTQRIAAGDWRKVSGAAAQAERGGTGESVLIFDDTTGRLTDVEVAQAAAPTLENAPDVESAEGRGRGRPKLGVTPREVTLLPRHWEWLAAQPGGTSVTLRRLVEEARRKGGDKDQTRKAQERTYAFISAVAGDFTDFEEASRALFANDRQRFGELIREWPADVRDYALSLAGE
ncbi:MAG: DUF2239 family protein [Chloroflexi bacterium]|nr:DUF2239 family protein [Chloroflexota bacterium]MCC6894043.1 DUF2239 family protein [Anaerolineae bacterium]